jgi:hypothetical protein
MLWFSPYPGYHSPVGRVGQMGGSQWGAHELLRSVHTPVDRGADDDFAGFDSKEEMVVAVMDRRLARGIREAQDALAHEVDMTARSCGCRGRRSWRG